jgi:hypothetical protein
MEQPEDENETENKPSNLYLHEEIMVIIILGTIFLCGILILDWLSN